MQESNGFYEKVVKILNSYFFPNNLCLVNRTIKIHSSLHIRGPHLAARSTEF